MTDIEIPYPLNKRPRDRRGLPIPFGVFVDNAGVPHFTINDVGRVDLILRKKLCGLCGLPHKLGKMWFIGGPSAAFHEKGLYIDPPVHEACGRYAIRVCPFIAAPNYSKRIETKTVDPKNVGKAQLIIDNGMDPSRPPFFTFCRASGYRLIDIGQAQYYIQPRRPWREIEFWLQGEQITGAEAAQLLEGTEFHPDTLAWWDPLLA